MQTIVSFLTNKNVGQRYDNRLFTRSLLKIGLIDSAYVGPMPKAKEHWVVEIVRENIRPNGGSFLLRPVKLVTDHKPLLVNRYDMAVKNDAVIVTPKELGPNWVMSPIAKAEIARSFGVATLVLSHDGGSDWERRSSPDDVLAKAAKAVTSEDT